MSNYKQGWYALYRPEIFVIPKKNMMGSVKKENDRILINYKSSLELRTFKALDNHNSVTKWSVEPFGIKYHKPVLGPGDSKRMMTHGNNIRNYFPDLFIQIKNKKYIAEIKPSSQIKLPKPPKNIHALTEKQERNYFNANCTYKINQAKWDATKIFCAQNDCKFILIDEKAITWLENL